MNPGRQRLARVAILAAGAFVVAGCQRAPPAGGLELMGQEEVVEALEARLTAAPSDRDLEGRMLCALEDLGRLYLARGLVESADRTFQKALRMEPDRPGALRGAAEALERKREPGRALELRRRLVVKVPGDLSAWIGLGDLYLDQNRNLEAVEAYQRGLSLAPGNPACLEGIDRAWPGRGREQGTGNRPPETGAR